MAKVIVMNWITLDGVMQGPGRLDEDTRDGFSHGGWAADYSDSLVGAKMGERMAGGFSWLFGRRTYDDLLASWNAQGGPFKDSLNNTQKYVASRDPSVKLEWRNSTLLHGDVCAAITDLKETSAVNLVIMGSGELLASLIPADLIDEYLLLIAPLILGTGRRLFPSAATVPLRLLDCATATTGALIASYEPARREP